MKRPTGFDTVGDSFPERPEGSPLTERHEAPESVFSAREDAHPTDDPGEHETVPLERLPVDSEVRTRKPRKSRRVHVGDEVRRAKRRLRAATRQHKRERRRETRRFTAAVRRTRRQTLIVIGALLALVMFVLVGAYTPLMAVRDVQVAGAQQVNAAEVQRALERFEGVPLASVNENDVLRALEQFPLIQRFAVERVPPHTLRVRIEERVPVISLHQGEGYRHFDAAGVLVGEAAEPAPGIPVGSGSLLNIDSPAFHEAARVIRDMPEDLRAQLVTVTSSTGQDVSFTLTSGIEVFWGSADETQKKSVILETMIASLTDRAVTHIDVSSTVAPIFK